jgi:hypothetical protein
MSVEILHFEVLPMSRKIGETWGIPLLCLVVSYFFSPMEISSTSKISVSPGPMFGGEP